MSNFFLNFFHNPSENKYAVEVSKYSLMKTGLNKQLIAGIAAGGTTLILLKGGDYKWFLLAGFTAILFILAYVYKK